MESSVETMTKMLLAYPQEIKKITSKHRDHLLSQEIEAASQSIDQFLDTFQQLETAQKKFDRYVRGLSISFSPEKGASQILQSSESFKDWTEYVSKCMNE